MNGFVCRLSHERDRRPALFDDATVDRALRAATEAAKAVDKQRGAAAEGLTMSGFP